MIFHSIGKMVSCPSLGLIMAWAGYFFLEYFDPDLCYTIPDSWLFPLFSQVPLSKVEDDSSYTQQSNVALPT